MQEQQALIETLTASVHEQRERIAVLESKMNFINLVVVQVFANERYFMSF